VPIGSFTVFLGLSGGEYHTLMKTKPQSEEYKRFENLLGGVLSVPKAEIDRRIEEAKREKRTPKSASRASAVQAKHT
jgi:hypothetical protein